MVNRYDEIYVERSGKLTKSDITFSTDQAVLGAIERIVAPLGRRIDESSPMVDARLKDGSRVNAVIPPLALKGCTSPSASSRKRSWSTEDLIRYNSVTAEMMEFLKSAVEEARQHRHLRRHRLRQDDAAQRPVQLHPGRRAHRHHRGRRRAAAPPAARGLARIAPAQLEGKGAVTIRDLVKNCLRMRPDRIVVGECRGGEALDMLQAMNTGHDGSLTTPHANTPRDGIARLEVMTLMAGLDLPVRAIREQIASAVHIIVQQSRFPDGSRQVTHITEVTGMEGDIVQLQDIFLFKQEGYDDKGKVKGRFIATGNIPDFYQDLSARGIPVDLSIFKVPERN